MFTLPIVQEGLVAAVFPIFRRLMPAFRQTMPLVHGKRTDWACKTRENPYSEDIETLTAKQATSHV
jgi:hypothetical protein